MTTTAPKLMAPFPDFPWLMATYNIVDIGLPFPLGEFLYIARPDRVAGEWLICGRFNGPKHIKDALEAADGYIGDFMDKAQPMFPGAEACDAVYNVMAANNGKVKCLINGKRVGL